MLEGMHDNLKIFSNCLAHKVAIDSALVPRTPRSAQGAGQRLRNMKTPRWCWSLNDSCCCFFIPMLQRFVMVRAALLQHVKRSALRQSPHSFSFRVYWEESISKDGEDLLRASKRARESRKMKIMSRSESLVPWWYHGSCRRLYLELLAHHRYRQVPTHKAPLVAKNCHETGD